MLVSAKHTALIPNWAVVVKLYYIPTGSEDNFNPFTLLKRIQNVDPTSMGSRACPQASLIKLGYNNG